MNFFKQNTNDDLHNKTHINIKEKISYVDVETKNLSTLYLNHKINNINNIIISKTIENISKIIIEIFNLIVNSNIYEYTKILKYSLNKIRNLFNKIIIIILYNFNEQFFYIINQNYLFIKINSEKFIKNYNIVIQNFENIDLINKTFNKFYITLNKFKKIIDFIFSKYFNSKNSSSIFI